MVSESKPRRIKLLLVAVVALVIAAAAVWQLLRFPPDTTPEGAYMRIAFAISRGEPEGCFAYLEEDAQHATFTISDFARKASARIREAYPEPARAEALARYQPLASAADAAALWAQLADERGWIRRLRRDLSGVSAVEVARERATVVTARGTRYPFRRRPNGIWGLTSFTAELVSEAEHLVRDWELIQRAANDYQRAPPYGDE